MLVLTRALLVVCSLAACTPPTPIRGERYEFAWGRELCIDKEHVADKGYSTIYEPGGTLVWLGVRTESAVVYVAPDQSVSADFQAIATFMSTHPASITPTSDGGLLSVDVSGNPRLLAGNPLLGEGPSAWVVSSSIRDVDRFLAKGEDAVADIFLAYCPPKEIGNPCYRKFPFHGFQAAYALPESLEGIIERDKTIRTELAAVARPCEYSSDRRR